jgi:ketosteroid isomerase-like protein
MKLQRALSGGVTALVLVLGASLASENAHAQKTPDRDGVKAANQAFYAALSARDVNAMQKVWSSDRDIQNIGPRSKAPEVGWPAIKKSLEGTFANFVELKVTMEDARIKLNGSTAWVSGIEKAQRKTKAGQAISGSNLGTSIFMKQGGRWLMVYHHASAIPKEAPGK